MLAISLIVIVLLVIVILQRKKYNEFWKHVMLIPGPKGYPIVGNVMDSLNSNAELVFKNDRLRGQQFYPICKLHGFGVCMVCLVSPEDIEIVLTNMKHITKGKLYHFLHSWLGKGLLTSTGSQWQARRKILTPAFHFNILQEFIGIFNKETENLVEVLAKRCNEEYIDVVKPISEYTLYSIGETSLGVNLNDDPNCKTYKETILTFGELLIHRLVRPWLHISWLYNLSFAGRREKANVKILHDFSKNVIQERLKVFKPDDNISYATKKRLALLDLLLSAKFRGEDIDDEGIREEVDTFMFEGHDTSSMAICYTLMALANEKKIQEEIRKEIHEILGDKLPTFNDLGELKFMERCIKECLRLYPSVPVITRLASEDIKTHSGYTIPKGADVNMYIIDLHRSPKVWENPLKFDPNRFLPENVIGRHPFAYLPFSAGPRNCIGQRFAILEIKAALCGILRKFKLEPVHKPEDMRFKADLVLRPYGEIRVKFVPIEVS